MAQIPQKIIESRKDYKYGTIDAIEDISIPNTAASRSLGWLTKGDHIELTRGRKLLGTEQIGLSKITGLRTGFKADGTQVFVRTRGKKIEYYNIGTSDWVEIGSDALGSAVITTDDPYGEDISIEPYSSLSGAQLWLNSPHISGPKKIMTANPGTAVDQYDASKNFKGYMKIKTGRMWLWNRGPSGTGKVVDKTGLYGSKIDRDEVSDFTAVTAEALGLSGSLTYTGTLSTISGKKTCFGITITDTSETFLDDKNGVLLGSAGGTGTINYATGAYSVTFAVPAVGAVTADYYTEDASVSGIADFTKTGTRVAGEGFIIRQDDNGGAFQNLCAFASEFFCLHELKTWLLTISTDDLTATNKIFREKAGIPNWRAQVETGDGIFFIDATDPNNPVIRLLTLGRLSTDVIPVSLSKNLTLSGYVFDRAAGCEFGDYIVWACRTSDSTVNNRLLVYSKLWKSHDFLPFYASVLEPYNGVLHAGDSLSANVYELFSGLDDDDSVIENFWEGPNENLGMEGLKKTKLIPLEGNIGPEQSIRVYVSIDKGPFVEFGVGAVSTMFPTGEPAIYGGASYVDRSQRVDVGSLTLGRGEVGGGSTLLNNVEAYHYKREIPFGQDRFERAKIKYVAQGIGYASVSQQQWKDIRRKNLKIPSKYRA